MEMVNVNKMDANKLKLDNDINKLKNGLKTIFINYNFKLYISI